MKFLKTSALLCCVGFSGELLAERELPNFEIGLGGGKGIGVELFNLDFTVNIPMTSFLSSQINLDSNYVFGDPDLGDFAVSEFNGMGFIRVKEGRIGAGLGTLQLKSKSGAYETEQVEVVRGAAALYVKDVTFSWDYAKFDDDFRATTSLRAGLIWYPSERQKLALFRERYDSTEGWRLESFVQPQKYRQHLALGVVLRGGNADIFPYMGLALRYYFDRGMSFKQRERSYH